MKKYIVLCGLFMVLVQTLQAQWNSAGGGTVLWTSDKVGIGTSTPGPLFEISFSGITANGIFLNGTGEADAWIQIENGGGTHWIFDDASSGNSLNLQCANRLNFMTGGANVRMYIDDNGDIHMDNNTLIIDNSANAVGLGVSPTEKLTINDGNIGLTGTGKSIRFLSGPTLLSELRHDGSDLFLSNVGVGDSDLFMSAVDDIHLGTNGSDRLVIEQDGRINLNSGLFRTNPASSIVEVSGNVIHTGEYDITGDIDLNGFGDQIRFRNISTGNSGIFIYDNDPALVGGMYVSGINKYLKFSNSSSLAGLFVDLENNFVGVNTSSPNSLLEVQVNNAENSGILINKSGLGDSWFRMIQGSTGDTMTLGYKDFDLVFEVDRHLYFNKTGSTGEGFYFDTTTLVVMPNSNRVGIGTINPDAKLEIEFDGPSSNGLSIDGSGEADAWVRMANGGGTHYFFDDVSDGNSLNIQSAIELNFRTDVFYERMSIKRNGDISMDDSTLFVDESLNRVGIGTPTPQTLLEVAVPTGGIANGISLSGGGLADIWFRINNGPSNHYIFDDFSDGHALGIESSSAIRFNTAGFQQRMRIEANGDVDIDNHTLFVDNSTNRVGIGTNTPAFDLQVAGDVDITGELTAASDARLKENVRPIQNALETLSALNPVSYDFRVSEYPQMHLSEKQKMGLIAQEVAEVLPNLVVESQSIEHSDGELLKLKSVNYLEMIPLIIKAIQESDAEKDQRIEKLEAQNAHLQAQIDALMKRLDAID